MKSLKQILSTGDPGPGVSVRKVPPQVWEEITGMGREKDLIERRVLWPLSYPEAAGRNGVRPPRAILLFGPPGTGKTAFAQGIAGRLGWGFVEVNPGDVGPDMLLSQPMQLKRFFDELVRLSETVIFFDEFEFLALRPERASSAERQLASEMLRQIPRFREGELRLLVCATNHIDALTPALLRPGRFDYILPVGPLDREGRRAVFTRHLQHVARGEIDMEAVLAGSEIACTPAAIQAVCAEAAHLAFEREVTTGVPGRVGTADLLAALARQRPSIAEEDLRRYREDAARYCRADYCPMP